MSLRPQTRSNQIACSIPQTHHLDKWAPQLSRYVADGDPDEMLPTKRVAELLHVTETTLEIWRSHTRATGKLEGPPFVQIGPRLVRYRRGTLVKWLTSRSAKTAKRRRA